MKKLLLLFMLLQGKPVLGQYFDLNTFPDNWLSIREQSFYSGEADAAGTVPGKVPFIFKSSINAKNYYQKHHIYVYLKNSKSTADSVHFFCGHWVNYKAFSIRNGSRTELPVSLIYNAAIGKALPMLLIPLQAGDSITIDIVPDVRSFNYLFVSPYLVKHSSLNEFGYAYYLDSQKTFLIISFIFMGILLVMFIYALISWYREKNIDYLYYGAYVLLFIFYFSVRIGTMFITSYAVLQHNLYAIHLFQIAGYIFYALFLISFLHLKKEIGLLYKILKYFNIVMMVYLAVDACLIYFTHNILVSLFLFTMVRYALLLLSIVTIFILVKQKKKISNYIAYGIFFLFLFGLISLLYTPLQLSTSRFHNFFDMRIPWYQLGIFLELIFFTMGLQYKTNVKYRNNIVYAENLKIENEKKEFESLMMVMDAKDRERSRIAQEIHDDIGSGLTNIRLLSEIAKNKYKDTSLVEMDKISASASELIDNMNEIIWSINAKNDYLSNLIAYIRRFVVTYFENIESITVKTNIPVQIPGIQISGEFRRSVFLTVKEALHNILKHAKATQVQLDIMVVENALQITIKDNGQGIDSMQINQFSNGLKNMRERVEQLGGRFNLTSREGTTVQLYLPLNTTT